MRELITVLKATMAGQMNIFKLGNKNNAKGLVKKVKGNLLVIFLTLALLFVFGSYAYMMAEPLHKIGLTYIIIILFAFVSTILVFMQGVYRSQGVLFDAKDSDLLFSMPIKKKTIFAARLIKLVSFEYIWTFISMVPVFVVYVMFEKINIEFILTALVIFITIPIIPIIVASIIGYVIQGISSRFKMHKILEFVFNVVLILVIFYFSFSIQSFITDIASKAQSLNDMITRIYYPIGIYGQCITQFSILKIMGLLAANIAILAIYVYIFSILYFKIISKLSEKHSRSDYQMKELKTNTIRAALVKKELKRYFSSPMYVLNTLFGPILLIISSVYIIFSRSGFEEIVQGEFGAAALNYMPIVYMLFMMFIIFTTAVTASSISLEGKSLWLTKSLPVSEKDIFLSKIIVNLMAIIPFTVISLIVFAIKLKLSLFYIIASLVEIIIASLLVSVMGLVINLKYPKLKFKSDIEVVKQSVSVLISVYAGFAFVGVPVLLFFVLEITNIQLYITLTLAALAVILIIMWSLLLNYGVKKFRTLNN